METVRSAPQGRSGDPRSPASTTPRPPTAVRSPGVDATTSGAHPASPAPPAPPPPAAPSPDTDGSRRHRAPDRCPGVPATWPYPAVPVHRLLADAVTDFPRGPALVVADGPTLDHAALARRVDRLALALRARVVRRLLVADVRPASLVLVVHAALRAGVPIVLAPGLARDEPAGPGHAADEVAGADDDATAGDRAGAEDHDDDRRDPPAHVPPIAALVPDWDAQRDLVVGSRGRARALGVPAGAIVVDDLDPRVDLVQADAHLGRVPRARATGLRGLRTLRGRIGRDRASLAAMLDQPLQGALPGVDADAVAIVQVHAGGRTTFTHRMLVAAVFQVRLWIPDMAAGTEVVALAIDRVTAAGLVMGPLLATLTGATLRVADDPVQAITGATVAFASPATWRRVAAAAGRWRPRLAGRGPSPATLRIGGVVVGPGAIEPAGRGSDHAPAAADVLSAPRVRAVVDHTQGARLRHFWTAPTAAGPIVAQPVYGRIGGLPGAVALPDTTVRRGDGGTWAAGPQFGATRGVDDAPTTGRAAVWHPVDGFVPAAGAASGSGRRDRREGRA